VLDFARLLPPERPPDEYVHTHTHTLTHTHTHASPTHCRTVIARTPTHTLSLTKRPATVRWSERLICVGCSTSCSDPSWYSRTSRSTTFACALTPSRPGYSFWEWDVRSVRELTPVHTSACLGPIRSSLPTDVSRRDRRHAIPTQHGPPRLCAAPVVQQVCLRVLRVRPRIVFVVFILIVVVGLSERTGALGQVRGEDHV
jgi:hypothetical protein